LKLAVKDSLQLLYGLPRRFINERLIAIFDSNLVDKSKPSEPMIGA
jgi:hypothetical protein